ncbi:tRNA 2-selenouridine(34) synthase MnmH [Rhabdobacter roseus]|uniref:tRNA 2-selenouridine synthase n=1 Tax=Rhabdobacter roseus TaxID=1655419 RepID=A0A840TWM0_9BACT|nr:tRNA 2-selenouridine(34) synthase MnmH [Rhabdobacter roseus]MBB5284598.1 tRNA 2-selenouridine synthase [Rhabdobacter roseus]
MIQSLSIDAFFRLGTRVPLADVRTPAEFEQGHVPGAFNLPLFSNDERVQVGTTYKQVGREEAILLGFDLTGPKWSGFIKQALAQVPDKKLGVHCWRGGMRSGAMAWALDLYGFEVYLIEGGYKEYRRWVRQQLAEAYPLWLLGGMTGSGKTKLLHELRTLGEQVIDLEDLAQHQGSSYGSMNRLVQPSQEQFENNLAEQLVRLDRQRRVWVEDESLSIGRLSIPPAFWDQMKKATLIELKRDEAQRVRTLVEEYGELDKDFLVACTERIHKRLGPLQTKQALAAIRENRMADFIRLVLVYYDKTYRNGLTRRKADQVLSLEINSTDWASNAHQILTFANTIPIIEQP